MTFIHTQEYGISNNLLHSHDAEAGQSTATYAKVKTIQLGTIFPTTTTLRIKFDMKSDAIATFAKFKIYKNGVAYGTEQSDASGNWVNNISEDLSFSSGDTIELWGYTQYAGYPALARNFRIYGDLSLFGEWGFSNT